MRRSTVVPLMLLLYLGVMSYIGFDEFRKGNYTYYFSIIGVTLVTIILLHFVLKRKEKLRDNRNKES